MEKPFAKFNKKMHTDLVVVMGGRPKLEDSWGPGLRGFLNSCWNQDLNKRSSASRASAILKREVNKVAGGGGVELNNFRRKSTFVNRDSLREKQNIKALMQQAMTM